MTALGPKTRPNFLAGVFLIAFSVLVFQIVQTRILSVIAWYYLAFFAISVAMLGMTAGAVWVYLRRDRLTPETLLTVLSDTSLLTAVAMPASVLVQFCLITRLAPTIVSIAGWTLMMAAMTVPYVFAGITVSLALTRSPFPVSLVYGVDLLGAALGCVAVLGILNVLDGPTAILFAGLLAAGAALAFARATVLAERETLAARSRWRKPLFAVAVLAALVALNQATPIGFRPAMVKDAFETRLSTRTELWNSYSRIVAFPPVVTPPGLWGPSPLMPAGRITTEAYLNIDGAAGTVMPSFDGTRESIDYLKYDIVNLGYYLPDIRKSAVIGVGGGRDVMSAHLFGVSDITGVELNSIFIDLHTRDPFYSAHSNLTKVPGVKLRVDDARSWFAATDESFDLIQMSMIDTWAATGAGAFSLSENGLYTLEGWRAFTARLTDRGVLTVSRWYSAGDLNEAGRMVALALATMMDAGAAEPRRHVFVARDKQIATLVLSKSPFSAGQLTLLRAETARLGFMPLVDPDATPESAVLAAMVAATDRQSLDRAAATETLDLTVPTDNRPFFFNQLRFLDIPQVLWHMRERPLDPGVLRGNLTASGALVLILVIALVAVVGTILLPLRAAAQSASRPLIRVGTTYFALIGTRLHVRGDLAAAVLRRLPRPSDLRAGRVPVQPDSLERHRQPGVGPGPARHGRTHHGVGRHGGRLLHCRAVGLAAAVRGDDRSGAGRANRGDAGGGHAGGRADGICVSDRDAAGGADRSRTHAVVLGHQRRHGGARVRARRDDRHGARHQRHHVAGGGLLSPADSHRARAANARAEQLAGADSSA